MEKKGGREMILYIEDNNKKAKAYIDSENGELFVSVYDEETDKQYDFGIDEKELQLIAYMIKQGKEEEK